jgi:hypothetical protein
VNPSEEAGKEYTQQEPKEKEMVNISERKRY